LWGQCGVEIRPSAIQPDSENTECWQFTGSLDAYGYGHLYSGNKEVKAHRAFYEAFEGPLPDGKYLQHHLPPPDRCIGYACCNPDHLQLNNLPRRRNPS
jgi:hypothetical protein